MLEFVKIGLVPAKQQQVNVRAKRYALYDHDHALFIQSRMYNRKEKVLW